MKVVVLGASGIIGQHMRLCVPDGVEVVWTRKRQDLLHTECEFREDSDLGADVGWREECNVILSKWNPDVVVNLAGESSPDVVERDPQATFFINGFLPDLLAEWCDLNSAHLIQVSTQGIFSGESPPYVADSAGGPCVNEYGQQKWFAERLVRQHQNWTIVRPTFVLGVRPLPLVGRSNPVEQILSGSQPCQVRDRYFSVSFASDVARLLWDVVLKQPKREIVHFGNPETLSRWKLATMLGIFTEPVSHDYFEGLAPRPKDTTYGGEGRFLTPLGRGIFYSLCDWNGRCDLDLTERARELSMFLCIPEEQALSRLRQGFVALHEDVRRDWNRFNPKTDAEILDWYRSTESYLWELSAYHADPGFNYSGMCRGIAERLDSLGAHSVLCLGDGIGDLTLSLAKCGFDAVYHDLAESRTAKFAHFRFWMHHPEPIATCETAGWDPEVIASRTYDAVISLDFLEHVTDVPRWTEAIRRALVPGGVFLAQNAFAIGSGRDGSIPCHLRRNDRFEKDWVPLLGQLQFQQVETSNWWLKSA